MEIDGAWKKIKYASRVEGRAGAGWYATWEGSVREGRQHILAATPMQAETMALWLGLSGIQGLSARIYKVSLLGLSDIQGVHWLCGVGSCILLAKQGEVGDSQLNLSYC